MFYGFVFIAVSLTIVGVIIALDRLQKWRKDREEKLKMERKYREVQIEEMKIIMKDHPLYFVKKSLLPKGITSSDYVSALYSLVEEHASRM